ISPKILTDLFAAGYDAFQIVNQGMYWSVSSPLPAREGRYADVKFNGHMSGLFGKELDPNKWLSLEETLERYTMFRRLKSLDEALAFGWLDFHASYPD